MNPLTVIIDPPSPELRALQDRINEQLAGEASVIVFTRTINSNPQEWVVVISFGTKRKELTFSIPIHEQDVDAIVGGARDWARKPRPVHARYQPFDL